MVTTVLVAVKQQSQQLSALLQMAFEVSQMQSKAQVALQALQEQVQHQLAGEWMSLLEMKTFRHAEPTHTCNMHALGYTVSG